MKKFDPNYEMLEDMYGDSLFPNFLVDKVKSKLQKVVDILETGETDNKVIQEKLDEAIYAINDLEYEFNENNSEIETVARESIADTVAYILKYFNIPIDIETAIGVREW